MRRPKPFLPTWMLSLCIVTGANEFFFGDQAKLKKEKEKQALIGKSIVTQTATSWPARRCS